VSGQDQEDLPYRPGVGVLLMNGERHVWVGRRFDVTSHAWQMPQGGIDPGESPEAAAVRELEEETGVRPNLVEIVAVSRGWHRYDLPADMMKQAWQGRYRGQRQKWFVMRFLGGDRDIDIATEHPEFSEWRWSNAVDLQRDVIEFKRPLYTALIDEFSAFF
jgi:putative (di)nucleoside polyphosphate hydrolase